MSEDHQAVLAFAADPEAVHMRVYRITTCSLQQAAHQLADPGYVHLERPTDDLDALLVRPTDKGWAWLAEHTEESDSG
jgi:hypothetical protein